ncbi:MAG: hypothetical protein EPN47_01945 [Acidobacteria bacterium]|nr:MAG: hypothetical protein EPN47_01945 [Acidobacteriota bacterium]
MPGSRSTDVPFCDDQLSLDDCPGLIVVGWALKLDVGADVVPTATVTDALLLPPLPVTVKVYVVVFAGLMVVVPCGATDPTPGSRSTDVPFCDDQLSLDDCPGLIELG